MTAAATTRTEPLWLRARAMFARASIALGGAAAIAVATLSTSVRRHIIGWLAPLEHVVRKLLLADAAALHRAACASARRQPRLEFVPLTGLAQHWTAPHRTAGLQTRTGGGVKERYAPEDAHRESGLAHPETWRAHFSFALPRNPSDAAHAPHIRDASALQAPPERTPRSREETDSAFRLARRFEALRRVLENPRPHAERLASALARDVRRFRQVVQRYLFKPCRSNDYDPEDPRLGIDVTTAAFDAPAAFPPDSS